MANNINELFQEYVNMEPEQLCGLCARAAHDVFPWLREALGDDGAAAFLNSAIFFGVVGDGAVAGNEVALYNAIFDSDLDVDQFMELAKNFNDGELLQKYNDLLDSLPDGPKGALLTITLCFAAIDGTITANEQKLFAYLAA